MKKEDFEENAYTLMVITQRNTIQHNGVETTNIRLC